MTTLQNSAFKVNVETTPFVGDLLPEPGAIVISEHDGNQYYADEYGWHMSGVEDTPFLFFVKFDGTRQFTVRWKAPVTSSIMFHFGDGTTSTIAGNGNTNVTTVSNYLNPGNYTVYLTGKVYDITSMNIQTMDYVAGSISPWGKAPLLAAITVNDVILFYGDIEKVSKLPLTFVVIYGSKVSGDVSTLRNATGSALFYVVYGKDLTFKSTAAWPNTRTISVDSLNSFDVGNVIKAFKNSTGSRLSLHLCEPRPKSSDEDLKTFVVNGNYIAVNELKHIGNLGPELHTTANGASIGIYEAGATTGWTPTGLGGLNTFTFSPIVKKDSNYSIIADCNKTPTASAKAQQDIAVTPGIYLTTAQWRHIGTGDVWRLTTGIVANANVFTVVLKNNKKFVYTSIYCTSAGPTLAVTFDEANNLNNGGIYFDQISVKKVTF
jgi:hypothetical protein